MLKKCAPFDSILSLYNLIWVTRGSKIGDIPLNDPIVIQIKCLFSHDGVTIFVFVIQLFIFIVLCVVYLSTDHVLSACGKCICSICICICTCILSPAYQEGKLDHVL